MSPATAFEKVFVFQSKQPKVRKNLYDIHQQVWNAMIKKENGHRTSDSRRDFIYSVKVVDSSVAVLVRAPQNMQDAIACDFPIINQNAKQPFSIRLPVIKRGEKQRSLNDQNECHEWFSERMRNAGFAVSDVKVGSDEHWKVRQHMVKTRTFSGVCQVLDEEKAKHAWMNGLGRMKGFGFGMLMLGENEYAR